MGEGRGTTVPHYTVHFQRRLIYFAAGLTDIQKQDQSLAGGFSRELAHGCGPESLAESQEGSTNLFPGLDESRQVLQYQRPI